MTILDPRNVHLHLQTLQDVTASLIKQLYNKSGKSTISLNEFLKMRDDLFRDIYIYEFNSFPQDASGQISGECFAKSLICYLDVPLVPKYLKRLKNTDFKQSVSLEQYLSFQKLLQDHHKVLEKLIEEKGYLTSRNLKKLIEKFNRDFEGKITPDQIDIFIQVLDTNSMIIRITV